jgi:hypothetical protein
VLRHVEFGEAEIGANIGEGREWPLAGNELRHELKALIESP